MEVPENNKAFPCHSRKIPLWLVLLDNIPTLMLFILGVFIISLVSTTVAIIFGIYTLFSVVWFWAKICPYCHHYDTYACPCGYGAISPRLFKKRSDKSFRKAFRQNLGMVFPNWFIPLTAAIYLMIVQYSNDLLMLSVAFCMTGFVIIPSVSKFVGCKNCEIKEDCPWMSGNKKVDSGTV